MVTNVSEELAASIFRVEVGDHLQYCMVSKPSGPQCKNSNLIWDDGVSEEMVEGKFSA